jgi:HEAT repeat protein
MKHKGILRLSQTAVLLAGVSCAWGMEHLRSADPPALVPAVAGLRISSDRWPDAFTLRSFAETAIRLEGAKTQEEEAIALYNWIARVMTIGGSPYEGPPGRESAVLDTVKIMAIYGNHWCDGQARLFETMWRSLGRQGTRLYIPMRHHSFVELKWRDRDGVERWHAMDVNNGWFVRNAEGWIASSEEIERNPLLVLAANQDLKMRTKGWLRTHLSRMPEHSLALHLRRGESCTMRWDNEGHYYVNPRTRASVAADSPLYREGGPYSRFIGGGEVKFVPDLADRVWTQDLGSDPENMAVSRGRLHPKDAGRGSSFVYRFDYPYLITDALVEGRFTRGNPKAGAGISVSVDGGKSWNGVWNPSGQEESLTLNLGAAGPSVAGLYSYLLRFELRAEADPAEVSFSGLIFTHRIMMNRMTLPNLEPGWNRFRIAAQSLAAGHGLRLRLEWSDKDGRQRIERNIERLPYDLDVFANCSGGAAVTMHSLRVQAVPDREAAARQEPSRIEKIIQTGMRKEPGSVNALLEALKDDDPEIRYWAADALGKAGVTAAVPQLIAALRDPYDAVRMSACVALGDLRAREALPELIGLVTGRIPRGKGYRLFIPEDVGAVQWMAARAMGKIGAAEAVDPLIQALPGSGGDLGVYIAEALGDLGDRRAVPALIAEARRRSEPALRSVLEALGRLGDLSAVPVLLDLLRNGQEDARYAAAVALGRLRGAPAATDLKRAAESDPQPYVREAAARALK